MRIRVLRRAVEDLASGREFYDRQRPGIGRYFLESIYSEIDSLAIVQGAHRIIHGCHRHLTKHFPYGIYYRMTADEILVIRVLDCRRDPNWTRAALGKKDRI